MQRAAEPIRAGWRFYVGVFIFGFGFVCPIFIPLIVATNLPTGWKTTLSGSLILGIPQLCTLTAIVLMGRSGFNYIKAQVFTFFRRFGPPKDVGRPRYRVGLVMFVAPLLFAWLSPYVRERIPGYVDNEFIFHVVGDVVFITSFVVLGGEFWEKVRALFVYDAKVSQPSRG